MTNENDDWIYDIIPAKQAEELEEKMQRIENDEGTIFSIVLSAPRSSAIQLCKTFSLAMDGNLNESFNLIRFVENIAADIERSIRGADL